MNHKKFSVIVPTKDRTELLRRALNSVQNQNYQNYEHYLINDLSTDDSLNVIASTLSELPENIRSKFKLINCYETVCD